MPSFMSAADVVLVRRAILLPTLWALAACGGIGNITVQPAAPAPPASNVLAPSLLTVTNTAPQEVGFGGTFIITGTHLTAAQAFSLNGTALTVLSGSDTTVSLRAPTVASTGTLLIVDTAGHQIATLLSLTAFDPNVVTISGMSPASVAPGNTLTINGTALDLVKTVSFFDQTVLTFDSTSNKFIYPANTPQSIVVLPSSATPTRLTVTVPETADGGGVQLGDVHGSPLAYTAALTIVKPIIVDWVRTRPTGTGLTIYIQGTQLDTVTTASVGSAPATIVAQSRVSLQLAVTASVGNSAPITLNSSAQAPVEAGLTSVVASGLSLNSLEFAQVHSQQATDPLLRLTPGRPVLVRELVTADSAQSPTAILTATLNGSTLGSVPMSPAGMVIPTNAAVYDSGLVGTSLDAGYDPPAGGAPNAFYAVMPAGWVQPGVQVQVAVTPDPAVSPGAASLTIAATPTVGAPTALAITVVPLQISGVAPVMPTAAEIQRTLAAAYPYAVNSINVALHAAIAVPATTAAAPLATLGPLLAFVESLRKTEGSTQVYFGLYPASALSSPPGFVGLAYRSDPSHPPSTWSTSAVAYDEARSFMRDSDPFGFFHADWQWTMIHELGHTHTRAHTDCHDPNAGSPGAVNFNFPYEISSGVSGAVGFQPLYLGLSSDTTLGSIAAPYAPATLAMTDVMGYCQRAGNSFFSTYNFYGVAQFAEAHNRAFPAGAASGAAAAVARTAAAALPKAQTATDGYVTLAGRITAEGVEFEPVQAHTVAPSDDIEGIPSAFFVRVRSVSGRVVDIPAFPSEVADSPTPATFFSVTLPNPGPIDSVTMMHRGIALPARMPAVAAPAVSATGAPTVAAALRNVVHAQRDHSTKQLNYSIADGVLRVTWNAAAEPYLSVTHVASNGARSVLVHRLTDGTAIVNIAAVPRGDVLEISLSTDRDARLVRVKRE